jgi:hypothetical protein
MIHAVRFRNFKALRGVENASGKTSVLEGLHHLTRLAATDPRQVFRGGTDVAVISRRGAEGLFELSLSGVFRGKRGGLSLSFAAIEDYPFSDTYLLDTQLGDRRIALRRGLHQPDDVGDPFPEPGELPLSLVMREAAFLDLDRHRLAEPAYSDLPTPLVAADGEGLGAVLADMAVSRPDDFLRIQDALRAVIPSLTRVRLARAKVQRRDQAPALEEDLLGRSEPGERVTWGHEIIFDMKGAPDIPARSASEGLLVLLGLFTALIGPERHQIVLIDHLERAVSPKGMGPFIAQLNQILALDPKLQIIATSDSLLLLDHMKAHEIRVHAAAPDGSIAVAGLHEHPDYEMLKSDLLPGEFLRELGDGWVPDVRRTRPPPPPRTPPEAPPQLPPVSR